MNISDKSYKNIFIVASMDNILSVLLMILFIRFDVNLFFKETSKSFITTPFFYSLLVIIFLFGIGYYIVSRDLTKHTWIVVLGALGRIFFAFYFFYLIIVGIGRNTFLIVNLIDLIFAILFIKFILDKAKK